MPPAKTRRQIEILAMVINNNAAYSIADINHHFKVEVAAIQRDLRELRAMGIAIHSRKNRVTLMEPLSMDMLCTLITSYLSVSGNAISYPKSISMLTQKMRDSLLTTFVLLVNAIENCKRLRLQYRKMYCGENVYREVEPYDIIPTFRDWRLIALSGGLYKQFLLENILEIKILDKTFIRNKDYHPDKVFRNSFNYWLGEEDIQVILDFPNEVAGQIRNGIWSETQEVEDTDEGVRLTLQVNSYGTIANWILGWGDTVTVVEPQELREYLISLAKGFLQANN